MDQQQQQKQQQTQQQKQQQKQQQQRARASLPEQILRTSDAAKGGLSSFPYRCMLAFTAALMLVYHNLPFLMVDRGGAGVSSPLRMRKISWELDEAFEIQDEVPSYLLSVRVVHAKNLRNSDLLSPPDCFVRLHLPTASSETRQTKTIWNSKNPVWDETFQFKIVKHVTNNLQLSVYDQDVGSNDDLLFTLCIDLLGVRPGKTMYKTFALNPEGAEEMDVEFKLDIIPGSFEKYLANGVLVARELSCLQVEVDNSPEDFKAKKELELTVKGSYEENYTVLVNSGPAARSTGTFHFHCVRGWDPEMTASLKTPISRFEVSFTENTSDRTNGRTTVPLNTLTAGEDVKVKLTAEKNAQLDLQLTVKDCPEDLDVRLGFDLCEQEKQFLQKRKKVVAAALKNILQLEEDLKDHEIPVVAVTATGGGIRAMTCMYSHLSALREMGLLDCVMYITGASGSTWAMSKLYEDPDWSSKDLNAPVENAGKGVMRSKKEAFSWTRLKYYRSELSQREEEGQSTSFTDLWGLILESMFHNGRTEYTLSDQKKALDRGQNPMPLYLAMNVKLNERSTADFKEWCEFSPYEVGLLKYGASVPSELFGSEFFMGRLIKKNPEYRICFLQGLWGNIYSVNLVDTLDLATNSDHFWDHWIRSKVKEIDKDEIQCKQKMARLKTLMYTPSGMLHNTLRGILTGRLIEGEQHNFLKGFQLHSDYSSNSEFCTWKDSELDSCANQLTPSAERLCLVDAGYFINASYPPLLKAQRNVDVILSFDYTLDTPLQAVEQTCKYCMEQGIAFPKIVLNEEEKKSTRECYTFADVENPKAPSVLHFPIVCDTFKEFKAPGVKRSPNEMEEGDVDVRSYWSPYYTTNFTYSEGEYSKLLKLTEYNLLNSKDMIVKALRAAVEDRKSRRS
ncbi:cytosolic phospholipase A2 delta [Ambystoma mexicanum]|uniref:cytosolic phospholipase A2 delta n=1 Tax=Ambystoma mexicanum TaxID=8296 RepID=UPI0037E763EA